MPLMLLKRFLRWPLRPGLIVALIALPAWQAWADDNMAAQFNDMDHTPLVDNPWGSVVNGIMKAMPGEQPAVDDNGRVTRTIFSPSIAVGDLNGDGLPDIVMADPKGYFWYFPNHGTLTEPKFTTGEVMPIWLGAPAPSIKNDLQLAIRNTATSDNVVSRIQLVDFSGEKRPSIVAGNFEGKLFYVHNVGSSNQPAFSMPNDLSSITVATYSENHLWCNFLSPFLYDFTGNGLLDLVMGEGTYASNSIYLLRNKGNNGSPLFDEHHTTKIVPGYGREHLTPQVVDWNNDGKPDIICGERSGFVDLFLNTSPDSAPAHLQFDDPPPPAPPNHITFGGQEKLGLLTTVNVCDLNNNKLPNLIVANSSDIVSYARNTGKLGAPAFGRPVPIPGVNPLKKVYLPPANWHLEKSYSMPYVFIASTNAQDDPTFKAPDAAPTLKSAIKIYTVPHTHTYFPTEVYPAEDTHIVRCDTRVLMQAGVRYDISFWMKTDGNVENPRYFFAGVLQSQPWFFVERQASASSDWTLVKDSVTYEKTGAYTASSLPTRFYFAFNGRGGTVWMTGFDMRKSQ
jgi:hypothetical protein